MSATDEAIVLAGGLGTRLRSVVSEVPKPLAPVRGRPFLAYLLDLLAGQGMRRVVLATGYLGERVRDALGTRWRAMELRYSQEPVPLGTGGAVALALRQIRGDACFVVNGDTFLALDYADFDAAVRADGAPLGVALVEVADTARYGAVEVANGQVVGFAEKGRSGPGYINAGVYRLERGLLAGFPTGSRFSFEADVLQPTVGRHVIAAYTRTHRFVDIGVPEDYARAQRELCADEASAP